MTDFIFPGGLEGGEPQGAPSVSTNPQVSSVSPTSARTTGGASITITGENFRVLANGTVPTVLFGTFPGTNVVVVDHNTITVDSPVANQAGQVDVSVQIGTQIGTLFGAFTLYTGTIESVVPNFGPIAGGTDVLISGFNFVTGSVVRFGGNVATSTFIDAQHIAATTPSHAVGFVDVEVEDPAGAIALLRNGFQYTLLTRGNDIRRQPGITIQDGLNNAPNTASFTVDGTSNQPFVGEEVAIIDSFDSNRRLFAGTALVVTQRYEGQIDQLAYDVQAVDFTFLLNKYWPIGNYQRVSASDIVKDLVARFAPGFTSAHVQTNLAKVTALFTGSEDFTTCLTKLAEAIGGGHWYVDYDRDVHFFHNVPPGVAIPSSPQTVPGAATLAAQMTVTEGSPIPSTFSFDSGWYVFMSTFLYSNNAESVYSKLSDPVYLDGHHQVNISNIPLGAAAGSLTVSHRRIYYMRLRHSPKDSSLSKTDQYAQIGDNTTTSFSSWFGHINPSDPIVTNIPGTEPIPSRPRIASPQGPTTSPTITPLAGPIPWFGGDRGSGRVGFLYRDGSISFPGPPGPEYETPLVVGGNGIGELRISNIASGPDVGGMDVIARLVWISGGGFTGQWPDVQSTPPDFSPEKTRGPILVPGNSTSEISFLSSQNLSGVPFQARTGQVSPPVNTNTPAEEEEPIPVWPNPDGPSLELFDPPDDIDDTNDDLLFETAGAPFVKMEDLSQVRNRVRVFGSGSTLVEGAAIGSTSILVTDIKQFSKQGGDLISGTETFSYTDLEGTIGQGTVNLAAPLAFALGQGDPINNFFQADDVESQLALGKVELDGNGNVTDGVHEYTIIDGSLKHRFQLYMRAFAEIEMFGRPTITISYSTRDPKTRSGAIVHVDLTDPPCEGDFLIQSVTIDQIHDESDQLLPRYTVRASSVKFELNDLLLKILTNSSIQGQTGGSGSVVGIIPGAVSEVPSSDPTEAQVRWLALMSRHFVFWGKGGNNAVVAHGASTQSAGALGGPTLSYDTDGPFTVFNPGSTGAEAATFENSSFALCRFVNDPEFEVLVKTGPTVADVRIFIGISTAQSNFANSDTVPDAQFAGVRFSTSAGDTGWRILNRDGTSTSVSSNIGTVTAETMYRIKISVTDGVATTVTINGTTVSLTTNVPLSAQPARQQIYIRSLNGDRELRFARALFTFGAHYAF